MKNIFRKIFYILLAVCLLGGGAYALTLSPQSETTFAENTTPQEISNNNLPEYFGVNETNGGGLISSNIFAYSSGASLSLSLKTNGDFNAGTSSVYEYVYYPDKEIHPDNPNIFHFYFYQVSALSLTINGETRNLDRQQFVTKSSEHFTNYFAADLHAFEIKFNETGTQSNEIKLLDDQNNLIEGIYSLNLQIVLFECTDGTTDASETQFENERLVDISYSFYVVNKSDYLTNNMPNVTRNAFDTEIEATTSSVFDYYLYSNYSSEDTTNSIPYIEYDYERYELSINKTISVSTYTQSLLYDIDTQSVVTTGDNIVTITQNTQNHTARVYFYNVGNYVVTYNDILLQEIDGQLEKHKLTGLSNQTKKYQIYVYGYQANYTDMDATPDSNNIRPVAELKTLDFEAGTFSQSADITSAFLNSNMAYSQATYNTSILISNVTAFIGNTITPIQTNQTPIKFTENARLSTDSSITSYIYTTNNLAGYAPTEYTLGEQEQTLYRKRFTGQAEGATGTYIYIITYTFDDFRTSSATTAPNKYFRQIFFFEINKELPTIKIETESGKNIRNFVNEDVLIFDTTKTATPYNKNVQIRIFARDFNNNFLASFGGTQGINYNDLLANENDEFITLSQSAFYTIRLYFENEIKGTTISFYNDTKKIREVPFAIDKMEIENIRGTNVSEILDSTDYSVVSTIEGLSTNQNFVLSWDRKASGAGTTAYYRYFKIDAFQYHTSDANFQSAVLEHMLSLENSVLPINNTLDMNTENNSWNIYAGNADTQIERGRVSAEYVFTDGGLYLVDIFDEAGNHAYDIFLLDYTTPIFAIYNTSSGNYSIPNSAEFVADDSVLYWSKYKGLIFTNFEDFYTGYTKEGQYSVSDNLLQGKDLYKNHDGEYVREIYNAFFDKIKTAGFLTHINCSTTPKEDTALYDKSYTGAYLTISISSTYWRLNENNRYEKVVNQYQESIDSSKELNYRIIIRDESNTKLVPNIADNTAVQHYTQHPSASQRIAVSFDTSNFAIFYTENGEREYLFSNNTAEQEIEGKTYKTTYLNPKSKETAFYLAFTPTQEKEGENITIQVSDVTINYYAYITESETIDGVVYNYMTLSENPVAIPVYEFDENSSVKETEEKDVPIKINIDGYTAAGKYVVTRRYQTGDGFTYNGKDFYSRTFVFYVDRNDVITNPDLVTNGSTSHLESLVGGDIFIAMYDNGETSDLVVTFPDSYNGNSKSSSLYNSGIPRTVLTTNKLPVSIYIPQYKYTKSVQKVLDSTNEYHFEVTPNEEMNTYYSSSVITEYLLYATLERANFSESGVETSRSLIARTSNSATPTSSSIFTDGHGFLRFYSASNNTPFYSLEESGRYYVTIYQGYLIGEDVQSLTFTFDIQKSDPDFEATSTSGTELGKIGNNYYTNQSTISLVWDASTSEYIADIDPDAIVFETNNSIKYTKSSDIWDEIWVQRPTLSNNSYISQISLEKLGVYSNGASVKVTMQYKNHSRYYQKVTKTIHVDLSAPSTTINNLISKSVEGSNISGLNASSLRTFYTAGMQETTGQDVSYNISNNSGTFAFYSYSVNESFINTLKTSPDYYRTYVKKFEGTKYQTGELQETSPADFLPSNYTEVSKASLTLAAGNYYEVVETDLAQNLTIYTIYVTNYSDDTEELITYKNAANEEFAYTIGDYKEVLSHSGANHNIYARTGFRLQDINYFGDEWAQFTLKKLDGANSSVTYYLMMSPWDKTHAFSIVNGELISFELSSLINGSINGQRKNVFTFKNRITGGTESFYINTRNVDLDARLTNVQEREYISFASPTNEQINSTTTACVYLTELKIMANDTPYYYNKTNRLGYASDWVSNENVSVSLNAGNFITFELSPSLGLTPNTKITYTYKTNYGIEYTEIHLYREKIISREVSSPNDIYAYRAANGTLIYVTKDKFEYHFNRDKYKVFIYDVINGERSVEQTTNATIGKSDLSDGETIYTLNQKVEEGGTPYYDNTYVLEIWDRNEVDNDGTAIAEEYHPVKYVYVTLYDKLPRKNKSTTATNEPGQFKLLDASRNNITERITESLSTDEAGYFSEITLMYAEDDTFIPVKYMISTDKVDWEEVASGTIFKNDSDQMQKYYLRIWYDTTYLANEYGSAAYVFGYIDQNQIYEFNLSSLTSTFWIEKTIDGITTILQKNGTIYRAPNGKQYSNHYVVNLSYASRDAVVIKTNREQDIVATNIGADNNGTPIADSDLVFSDIWLVSNAHNTTIPNLPKFTTYVVITYIPTSENFVGEFRTYDENGIISETEELLSMDKKQFIVTQDYSTISRVELQWTKYNGIEYNEINIAITKDGVALKPTIFTRKIEKDGKINSYNYCYLTNSGKYIISLYDNAGNIQKFKYGVAGQTDKFTFIFLKDVPFNVTYTNPNTGEQETSFPIKQAVYNGSVSLEIDKSTQSEFYSNGGYPSLTIYRNGALLDSDDYVTKEENGKRKFIFSRPGFYEYHFTAKSKELDTTIRQENYQFTIINANEYRYSYIFNKYSNYYVEKVVKNGKDITNRLLKTLNNETITIGQNQYLVELPLSYLDEKTGAGVYLITINSNNKFLQNSNIPSSWTYQVVIQVGSAPISISVAEGQGVTKAVSVTYNASNIYQEMGECTIQVMKHINGQLYAVYRQSIDESSSGVQSTKIDRSEYGSYFVQIVSPSGTLLYSYKVNKKEPMNAASILAIVGSVILFVVIVIIVYRLRKKIAVK